MSELEVQEILREIRERVRAGEVEERRTPPGESLEVQSGLRTTDLLARLEMHSRTTMRAWNRLPPLTSKRQGFLARLELWFKRGMRRATHWYAWEQVNFNAAVKDALVDVTAALSEHESELRSLRRQLAAATQMKTELLSRLSSLESSLRQLEGRFSALSSQDTRELRAEVGAIGALVQELRAASEQSLARLRQEQDETAQQLRDEHRVAFKQLSLEIKEQARVNERRS